MWGNDVPHKLRCHMVSMKPQKTSCSWCCNAKSGFQAMLLACLVWLLVQRQSHPEIMLLLDAWETFPENMYCVLPILSCVILAAMHARMEDVCAFDVGEAVLLAQNFADCLMLFFTEVREECFFLDADDPSQIMCCAALVVAYLECSSEWIDNCSVSTGIHAFEQHIHRAQHNFSGNKPSEDSQRVLITVTVLVSNTQKKSQLHLPLPAAFTVEVGV